MYVYIYICIYSISLYIIYMYIYIHTQPHTHTHAYCVYTRVLAYMTECAWIFRKEMAPPIPMLLKITSLGVYPIFKPT